MQGTVGDVELDPSSSKATNNTNGAPSSSTSGTQASGAPAPEKATRKSGRRSTQAPNGGLADIYNTAFNNNAALNKRMTPKGQERRFNSEAG